MRERCQVHINELCYVRAIDPPAQHYALRCEHCSEPIQAVAEHSRSYGIRGLRDYVWTHALSGRSDCYIVRHARPYDGWAATTVVEQVEEQDRADAEEVADHG